MADNVVERVKELFAQNKHKEAAELLLNENSELEKKLAESQSILEIATKELEEMKIERDHAFKKNAELYETKERGSSHGCADFTKFNLGELKKATKDFDNSLKIGEGSSGKVYKGFLRHTYVAIKLLEESKVQDNEFNQEVEVLSKVRHPNLVSLIGANPEARALVHEYLSNGGLDSYLLNGKNNKKLLWQDRLRIASEICSALIFLHSQGIAHGNLKPENVLLDSGLTSKVSDFGLSRKLEHSNETMSPVYVTARPKGSLAYIDPVYLAYGELTPQSDVFAFGIILLQFVTGRDPRGLRSDVEQAVDGKRLEKIVDSSAGKWPPKEALKLAELGLRCSDQRRRQRPDLKDVYNTIESIKHDASTSGHSKWF
ncbi:hypothetical protein LUZ60_009743 [Juncus effusus]|nr:hypothetical protein LUZ60_009743 [Juncus effusus]